MSLLFCFLTVVLFSSIFFWLVSLLLCHLCLFPLYVILALWPPVLQFQLLALLFVGDIFVLFFVVRSCLVWLTKAEPRARAGRPQTSSSPPPPPPPPPAVILLLAVPRRLFCFGSLVVLNVVFRYLSLLLLYININIGKNRC